MSEIASKRPQDIRRHVFSPSNRLFFDANIWLFLFTSQEPGDWRVRTYSDAFQALLTARSQIAVDVLVLSEFANRYIRIEYGIFIGSGGALGFKDYRRTASYRATAETAADALRRIMRICDLVETGLSVLDTDGLLNRFATGCSDFNDEMIASLCRAQGLTLVTHDSDFKGCDIPILTANRVLLN